MGQIRSLPPRAVIVCYSNGSRGPWGAGPPLAPKIFFFMQFSGNFKEKPCFEQRGSGPPPLGVKTPMPPLTKILDLRLNFLKEEHADGRLLWMHAEHLPKAHFFGTSSCWVSTPGKSKHEMLWTQIWLSMKLLEQQTNWVMPFLAKITKRITTREEKDITPLSHHTPCFV